MEYKEFIKRCPECNIGDSFEYIVEFRDDYDDGTPYSIVMCQGCKASFKISLNVVNIEKVYSKNLKEK